MGGNCRGDLGEFGLDIAAKRYSVLLAEYKMRFLKSALIGAAALSLAGSQVADACTRVLYKSGDSAHIVGRSMDWSEDTQTDLWVFPRGMERAGGGDNPREWTSKYGSVVASLYDIASVDGMNEAGLVVNVLYLAEADYGAGLAARQGQQTMSVGALAQYILDGFATVQEVVSALAPDDLRIIAPSLPNGVAAAGHVSISDKSGDSAIIEYVDGKLTINHSRDYRVMTNSPTYQKQLAISGYWDQIGGFTMLPGTNRAADRFARANFFVNVLPKLDSRREALASVLSVMRAVSVPLGINDPEHPEVASTRWRVVTDPDTLTYFYDSALSPNVFWVDLNKFDLSAGADVMKLELNDGEPIFAGEASANFMAAEPFAFIE
jgi:choloylglycine hydrolase